MEQLGSRIVTNRQRAHRGIKDEFRVPADRPTGHDLVFWPFHAIWQASVRVGEGCRRHDENQKDRVYSEFEVGLGEFAQSEDLAVNFGKAPDRDIGNSFWSFEERPTHYFYLVDYERYM